MSENRAVIEQELRRVLRHGSGQVLGLELGAPHTAPLAGQALRQGSGQAWQPARSYDAAIGGALARGAVDSWERADPLPTRRTITGDYLVPLLQAVTLGVLVGGGLLLTFGEPILARGAGTLATVGWYLRGIWSTGPGVLWRSETVFGRDINGDGHVGRPPAPEPRPSVDVTIRQQTKPNHWALRYASLPVGNDKLVKTADAVLNRGAAFSRRGLSEVLTQNEYEGLAGAMIQAGLLFELPGNKRELSAAGRSLLRRVLADK